MYKEGWEMRGQNVIFQNYNNNHLYLPSHLLFNLQQAMKKVLLLALIEGKWKLQLRFRDDKLTCL